MIKFKHKEDASSSLLSLLDFFELRRCDTTIVAISEQGIYYADEIARRLVKDKEVEFMFTEIIRAPHNKECALGCVSETQDVVLIDELIDAFEITTDFVYGEANRLYNEQIIKYMYKYRHGDVISSLEGKRVLLIDEGINSGLTLETCINSCINKRAAQVDVLIPLVPKSIADTIRSMADNCYFVYEIENFVETNFYFEDKKEEYEL